MKNIQLQTQEYKDFIAHIKSKIQNAQIKASIKVNEELLKLYLEMASLIVEKQKLSSWGDNFLEKFSRDLQKEFPNMKGFSYRNLRAIKQWYLFWQQAVANLENKDWQQIVAIIVSIPWGHNLAILSKCKDINEALFYVELTIENNYSRAILLREIEKNPYNFDFLDLRNSHDEKELEDALVENITKFLLELGSGFAYLGRQYKLKVGNDEFKIDLLFYHVNLHCFVVIELKTVDFKPEFAGKLNFYISAVDVQIKSKEDNPTIGILICKSKNDTVVEYSLKDINKPIGVSEYELTTVLPENLKSSLPTIEEIEAELGDMI